MWILSKVIPGSPLLDLGLMDVEVVILQGAQVKVAVAWNLFPNNLAPQLIQLSGPSHVLNVCSWRLLGRPRGSKRGEGQGWGAKRFGLALPCCVTSTAQRRTYRIAVSVTCRNRSTQSELRVRLHVDDCRCPKCDVGVRCVSGSP